MKLHYYAETDSLYIELNAAAGVETREVTDGVAVDLDAADNLAGIDIDHASAKLDLATLETSALPAGAPTCTPPYSRVQQPSLRRSVHPSTSPITGPKGQSMKITHLIAAGLMVAGLGVGTTAASAQEYRGDRGYDHRDDRGYDHRGDRRDDRRYDRSDYRDQGRHYGWDRGRHHGWNRHGRDCRTTWRYHRRVTVCYR